MRALLLFTALLFAGSSMAIAGISGKVINEAGQPVRDARVVIQKTGAPAVVSLRASGTGSFSAPRLTAGEYTVLFSAPGYEAQRVMRISIKNSAENLRLDATLRPAGLWGGSIATRIYKPQTADAAGKPTRARHLHLPAPARPGARDARMTGKAGMAAYEAVIAEDHAAPPSRAAAVRGARAYTRRVIGPVRADGVGEPAPVSVADGELAMTATDRKRIATVAAPEPAHAGMLTSGEINDFARWTLWEDIGTDDLKSYRSTWPFRPEERYTVLLKTAEGTPLCNARVTMKDGSGAIWESITDNTGKAELWHGMWSAADAGGARLSASVNYGAAHYAIPALKPFSEGINVLSTGIHCSNPAKLDVAFIVDATGSMGDEISYLQAELRDILRKVHDSMPATQVHTGALFYRDLDDEYLTRASDLTPDFSKTEAFIADNGADGGGDFPEAVDAALEAGLSDLHWRADATARLAFLVLDAPPRSDAATVKRLQELAAQYAARGIRLIPVVCSGSDKPTEYLMRALALATNGTYLFLTDHSGIGGGHTAPSTDKYDVEYLNGLIYRVIYQCAYMPACGQPVAAADTAHVQLPADSATTISWSYYPNPTTGILHIAHTHTSGNLLITDVTGKAILRIPADASGITTIDLGQYPAGIYAIRYNWAGDHWLTGKFVIAH